MSRMEWNMNIFHSIRLSRLLYIIGVLSVAGQGAACRLYGIYVTWIANVVVIICSHSHKKICTRKKTSSIFNFFFVRSTLLAYAKHSVQHSRRFFASSEYRRENEKCENA